MNIKLVLNTLGRLFLLIAAFMAIPLTMAFITKSKDLIPFGISLGITIVLGVILKYFIKVKESQFSLREAFAISAFGWLSVALVASFPMFITDAFGYQIIFDSTANHYSMLTSFINSYFEAISGLTGAGASVVDDIQAMPRPLLFWRCFHNSLGGMGILVLFVAILPSLGSAGSKIFRSESSISASDSSYIFPKIADLAKSLWLIHVGMILTVSAALMLAGMNLFDSLCHAFSTMGTAGFSTRNSSIADYNSLTIELILTFFMFIGSLNCLLFRSLLTRNFKNFFSNTEFKVYITVIIIAITSICLINYCYRGSSSIGTELRGASFTVVSLSSTTGLTTVDYDLWHPASKIILVFLMLMGGCASSTSGGLKVIRVILLFKWVQREFKKMLRPHGVFPIVVQDSVVENKQAEAAVGLFILYIGTLLGASVLVALIENDVIGGFSGVLASLSCIGPGFESLGPTKNYADLTIFSKMILAFCMLLGRLEMMALFVLVSPKIWKK